MINWKFCFLKKQEKGWKELTALCVCENKGSFIQVLLRMVLARKFHIPDFVLFINHSTHNISCCMVVSFCFPLNIFWTLKSCTYYFIDNKITRQLFQMAMVIQDTRINNNWNIQIILVVIFAQDFRWKEQAKMGFGSWHASWLFWESLSWKLALSPRRALPD